jgi:tRNA A-37 threonylcarbamoyl transferase component Bud32
MELASWTRLQQCWLAGNRFANRQAGVDLAVTEESAKLAAKKFPDILKALNSVSVSGQTLAQQVLLSAPASVPPQALLESEEKAKKSVDSVEQTLWITERLENLEFENAGEKADVEAWLAETFKASTHWAASVMEAVDEIVLVAKVATVILKLTLVVVERHEQASRNDVRVRTLCARLRELYASITQVRQFMQDQARALVAGNGATAQQTAAALGAPLQRVLGAVRNARDAIDAWLEVSRATGADQWASFKRWCGRVAKSSRHADLLAAASDELQDSLAQLGHVASLRAALSTASSWGGASGGGADDALRQWLQGAAQRDAEFCAAVQQDSGEVKERVMQLLPEFDAVLARQLASVHDKLDAMLQQARANLVYLPHDSFTDVGVLGAGAYGVVKSKRCASLGRQPVAVKELLLTGDPADDKQRRARFQREAELLSSCNHQSIVRVYGVVRTPSNDMWLVTELLDVSLERLIAEHAASAAEVWSFEERGRIAHDIALGLEHLHRRGILHRDLKSGNVMLNQAREAKLIDFGLSKDANDARAKTMTTAGVLSSSLWMAPEIRSNDDFCQATDIYAFGIVLAELLLLELPSTRTLVKVGKSDRVDWRTLIEQCTEEEARLRPTSTQCAATLLST